MAESKVVVPESVLKKIKREEEWALAKKHEAEAAKKKNVETRKLIFKRAEQYSKEYAEKDNELIRRNEKACKAFWDSRAFPLHWSDRTTFTSSSSSSSHSISVKLKKSEKMSGAGKKIADVAFKASRTIDWEGMAKVLVTDEARREFSNLRRAFDEVNTQLQTKFSQEPEPIDWDFYRKGIGSGIVDMYKEAFDSVEIPKYVDNVTPEYKPKFDALLVELKEAEQKSLKESERLEKEIVDVQEISKKLSTMTADEYFEKHPELKKKFDDEIRNDYWGY